MGNPKTIYSNNGVHVHFVDKSDEVKKTLVGLSKTALRASAKVIRKHLRQNIPMRSKRFKNHIGSWVKIDCKTGQPTLQIGYYGWQRVKKKGKLPSHANPWWVEFGTGQRGDTYSPNKKRPSPHIIEPKRAKVLTDKFTIYGTHVEHQGQRALHVLRDTCVDNMKEIRDAQKQYLAEISKTLEAAGMKVDKGNEFEDTD